MKRYIPQLFIIFVIAYLIFLIRPALFGQLTGTFQPHIVPQGYTRLEKFLNSQSSFSRTFWVPTTQRFGFYSSVHPAVSGEDFYHVASISGVLDNLRESNAEKELQKSGIQYVIVPFDSEAEIFLKDRKYDAVLYKKTIENIQKIAWLKELPGFGEIHVFKVPRPKDHFWLSGQGSLNYTVINPTKYTVTIKNVEKGERLVFSESYDKYWIAQAKNEKGIKSQQYNALFNSFELPKDGSDTLTVEYAPQKLVNIGLWISGVTALAICLYFISYFVYGKKHTQSIAKH